MKWRHGTGKRDRQLNPGYTHNMANTNAKNNSNVGPWIWEIILLVCSSQLSLLKQGIITATEKPKQRDFHHDQGLQKDTIIISFHSWKLFNSYKQSFQSQNHLFILDNRCTAVAKAGCALGRALSTATPSNVFFPPSWGSLHLCWNRLDSYLNIYSRNYIIC